MLQRRTLLKTGAAVALGAPGLSGLAQQSVTLKFHTFMAPQSADRKSTRLNSSHVSESRMPSSA